MIKKMNKKQWYETLERYSELATQRKKIIREYGIQYWDKEKELTSIQDALLQQRRILMILCEGSWGHETQLDAIFVLIENLEPISKEMYQKSYVKSNLSLDTNIIYMLIVGIVILFLHKLMT